MKKLLSAIFFVTAGSFGAIAGPYISANPAALNSFNYTTGSGPSASQIVVLQSSILGPSSGNILVTSPADYEISLNNSSFSSSVSIPFANDTLGATNVYVRLKSNLANGNYNNETLAVTSPGANASISLNGLVTSACVITTGAITGTTAAFTWNATGATSYEVKIDNAAGAPTTSGTAVSGTSYSATALAAGTSYYFHVRGNGG